MIRPDYLQILYKHFPDFNGVKMLEIGDEMWSDDWKGYHDKVGYCKPWFQSRGIVHTSIDKNGKGGAIQLDLCSDNLPVDLGLFDVVTNFGTIEHVKNIFNCCKHIHDFTSVGGLQIHVAPCPPQLCRDRFWINHGYWYIGPHFFAGLAEFLSYEIIELYIHHSFAETVAVLKKTQEVPFMSKEDFSSLPLQVDGGGEQDIG